MKDECGTYCNCDKCKAWKEQILKDAGKILPKPKGAK